VQRMKVPVLLAVLTALAAGMLSMVPVSAAATALPAVMATPDIVGGVSADQPYPAEGTLLLDHGDGRGPVTHCGVTLVAKYQGQSWFAGNAHCATFVGTTTLYNPSVLRIGLGSNNRSQQTLYPLVRNVDVPFWNWIKPTGPNGALGDVALFAVPVLVPEHPMLILPSWVGEPLRIIGWGLTTTDASGHPTGGQPDGLQQLDVREITANHCAIADPGIATGEFCINSPHGDGPCFGDSGSAGMKQFAGRWVLVGSLSRGDNDDAGTCGGNDPGILTSWWYYLPFFAQTIFGANWSTTISTHPLPRTALPITVTSPADQERRQIAYALAG
jgi:Trypsin